MCGEFCEGNKARKGAVGLYKFRSFIEDREIFTVDGVCRGEWLFVDIWWVPYIAGFKGISASPGS